MPKARKTDLLWSWFIDPFLRAASPVLIENNLEAWYAALECETLDIGVLGGNDHGREFIADVWCNDIGMYHKPRLPTFLIGPHTIYGYGLIFERDGEDTASVGFDAEFLVNDLGLHFEAWEQELDPKDYFEQLTRVIEWETWCKGRWQKEKPSC